jgi:hypothetical protein
MGRATRKIEPSWRASSSVCVAFASRLRRVAFASISYRYILYACVAVASSSVCVALASRLRRVAFASISYRYIICLRRGCVEWRLRR